MNRYMRTSHCRIRADYSEYFVIASRYYTITFLVGTLLSLFWICQPPRTTLPITVSSPNPPAICVIVHARQQIGEHVKHAHHASNSQYSGNPNPSYTHRHYCERRYDYDPARSRSTAVMALFAFVNMQLRQLYTQHDGHRTPTHCLSVRKYGEEVMADVTLRDVMRVYISPTTYPIHVIPVRLYIYISPTNDLCPLSYFLALHLTDGRSDYPLGTDVTLGLLACDYPLSSAYTYPMSCYQRAFLSPLSLPFMGPLIHSPEAVICHLLRVHFHCHGM